MPEVLSVDPPDVIPVTWRGDRGGSRFLFNAKDYSVPVTFTPNPGTPPRDTGRYEVEIVDSDGNRTWVYRRTPFGGAAERARDAIRELGRGGGETTVSFPHQDDNSIITQYSGGSWSDITPGEVTVFARVNDRGRISEASAPSRFVPPADAPVKDNFEVTLDRVGSLRGETETTLSVTGRNRAAHGVDVPFVVEVFAGGERVFQESLTRTFTGVNPNLWRERNVRRESFSVQLSVPERVALEAPETIVRVSTPKGWFGPVEEPLFIFPPSDWVSSRCLRLPNSVIQGEKFTAGATLSNDGSVDVPVSYQVSAGDDAAEGTTTVPANGSTDADATVTATDPGEIEVQFNWSVR
jgi:hypothetical protein